MTTVERLVQDAYRPDRLYPIVSDKYRGHYAGRLPDGRQALVTCGYPKEVCAFLFTAEGDYFGVERREPELTAEPEEEGLATNDAELHRYLAAEFGFAPGLIRVKRFAEPSEMVSIEPLPVSLAHVAAHPESASAGDLEDLRSWVEQGEFVLCTWNDYYLDATGEVTAS
jgi:hypothetical protein